MDIAQAKNIKIGVQRLFKSPDCEPFLEKLCHFRKPLWTGNTEAALIAEGQRQVFLTLKTINECEPEQLVHLYEQIEKGA